MCMCAVEIGTCIMTLLPVSVNIDDILRTLALTRKGSTHQTEPEPMIDHIHMCYENISLANKKM